MSTRSGNFMVNLDRPPRKREWFPERQAGYHPLRVTRSWSRWRCARGWKIHRARFAQVYRDEWFYGDNCPRPRLVVTFWCGQSAQRPIPFREECAEGTEPCAKCDGLWAAQGLHPIPTIGSGELTHD